MLGNRAKYTSHIEAYDIFRDYLLEMGFGRRLGVDLPSEARGVVPTSRFYTNHFGTERWHAHNIISIAIGQGEITSSPLQIANFAAMVANRGYFYTPRVVRKIMGDEPELTRGTREVSRVNRRYFELAARGMADAVANGTAWRTNLAPDIIVAGKTGTAENPRGDSHALFMGFAPVDNPQVAFAVVVENARFGGINAVPIARLMLQKFFRGEIPESDKWMEEQIINRVILPPIYTRHLPPEQRDVNLWVQQPRR
jgi:penicillin-binding protein 2